MGILFKYNGEERTEKPLNVITAETTNAREDNNNILILLLCEAHIIIMIIITCVIITRTRVSNN